MGKMDEIFKNKALKPSAKVEILAAALAGKEIPANELVVFASLSKDPVKASCIEALEHVSLKHPDMINEDCWEFAVNQLPGKAPRVKWESARLIGNVAHLFPEKLGPAIAGLLANSEYPGTVVRWSAAFALSRIMEMKSPWNKDLIPAVEVIIEREEKNSIRKIYIQALKKQKNK